MRGAVRDINNERMLNADTYLVSALAMRSLVGKGTQFIESQPMMKFVALPYARPSRIA